MSMHRDKPAAVAVKYISSMPAPVVIHKGQRLQADRIVAMANEFGIQVVQDIQLVEDLYELQIEELIPEKLYEPVARLLQFVYTLNNYEGTNR